MSGVQTSPVTSRPPDPPFADGEGWAAALNFAVRELGMPPEAFWRLSVAEWRMLTGATTALGRDELTALMARFPDGAKPSSGVNGPAGIWESRDE